MPTLSELYGLLKGYARDALPGGSLNPEGGPAARHVDYLSGLLDAESPVSRDVQGWHKRTQTGLADQLAGRQTPEAEQAYQTMMMAAGMAPIGMTAWHGSPHKFDKFSLDKIGTGEGAQAYGHGLYLAESPEVAKEYQRALGRPDSAQLTKPQDIAAWAHSTGVKGADDAVRVLEDEIQRLQKYDKFDGKKHRLNDYMEALAMVKQNAAPSNGNLYKTDIPDEAVARFLDWDKPLSQQAPEVQKAIHNSSIGSRPDIDNLSGNSIHDLLMFDFQDKVALITGRQRNGSQQAAVSEYLQSNGVPGIRYLDGGSRSSGSGSSNFVAFDPEMIRILERNGQPTGLQPWKPGEYKLRDLITN